MGSIATRGCLRQMALICSIAIAPGDTLLYPQPSKPVPASTQTQTHSMGPEQLDSMVAPIALYPDSVLGQVLAASTYPLEIVSARRWVKEHSNLTGKALVEAAGKQDWDPSVQALVAFPTVLETMDQNLEWTTALGNAFLSQQADVMSAVQRMRQKAQASGKLESNEQQQVQTTTVEGQPAVVIQPANPEVIYVPAYDPVYVYGAAPPYYPYPPMIYPSGVWAASAISFGVGVAVGALFNGCCGGGWGWGWGCNWGARPSLYVNNNFFTHNRNTFVNRGNWGSNYVGNGRAGWNHNPRYRGGVPYPNRDVANRFNGGRGGLRPSQLPANVGNIRPPGSLGNASRLPGGGLGTNPPGGGRATQLPSNSGLTNRPGGRGASQLSANPGGNRAGGRTSGSVGSANRSMPGRNSAPRVSPGHRANVGGGAHRAGGGGRRGGGGSVRGGGGRRR